MWNPVTGCTKVSPGCAHCYAECLAARLRRMGAAKYARRFEVALHRDALDDPLRAAPAAVKFLSLEPLLGPLPSLDLAGIDWVIDGGESGPGARPMQPDLARGIRDRCMRDGVPFFFKQWGRHAVPARGSDARRTHLGRAAARRPALAVAPGTRNPPPAALAGAGAARVPKATSAPASIRRNAATRRDPARTGRERASRSGAGRSGSKRPGSTSYRLASPSSSAAVGARRPRSILRSDPRDIPRRAATSPRSNPRYRRASRSRGPSVAMLSRPTGNVVSPGSQHNAAAPC